MKQKTIFYFFIFAFLLLLLHSPNPLAQRPDHTTWGLPEGAIARLGKGTINDLAYSPDGHILAVVGSAGIWLYETNACTEIALLTVHSSSVYTIAFSPDGRLLASGGSDNTVKLWDVAKRGEIETLKGHSDGVLAVAFPDEGGGVAGGVEPQTRWRCRRGSSLPLR